MTEGNRVGREAATVKDVLIDGSMDGHHDQGVLNFH